MLASREHSRRELRHKLCGCGYAEADVERLIEELAERGLVSDQRMAETYVAERIRKGFGPLRIRQELYQKGLPDDLVESALAQSQQTWLDAMSAAHDKKFGPGRAADAETYARRARFLEYRGFPAELIIGFLDGRDNEFGEF